MWARWANVILGAWLALSPLLLNTGNAPLRTDAVAPAPATSATTVDTRPASAPVNSGITWNNVISGLIIIGCALAAMMPAYADIRWVNLVVGFWTLISPAIIPHEWSAMTTNNVVSGILVMLFAMVPLYQEYGSWTGRETTYRPGRTPPTTPTTPTTPATGAF
jgi:hypothetical protein